MSTKIDTVKDQHEDPVCNMTVSGDSEYQYQFRDKHYYFCSKHCLHKFEEHPEQYLDTEASPSFEADMAD